MPVETLVWVLPLLSTAILGSIQLYVNWRNAQERMPYQNYNDSAAAIKALTEANIAVSKELADEKVYAHGLEERIKALEVITDKQKIRVVMDITLAEKPRIVSTVIDRIVTGPLNPNTK